MIPKELAKKIRYIQIYTSKTVNDVLDALGVDPASIHYDNFG